jgi:hypothetical protein
MRRRTSLTLALALLLAGEGAAQQDAAGTRLAQPASDRALREWAHSIGVLGYVYGAPLLELAIAEYRQTHGIARDMSGPRGVIAHGMGGRLPTHETTWLATPNPDVLHSSAWLDVEQQPYVLWIPPMDGHWYSVQLEDSFTNDVAYLSSRTVGSVGGWYLIAHESWAGERPPSVMDEIRIPTPIAWLLLRIAATEENAADFHARYQAQFKLLPLAVYARNPKAAALAGSQPQASPKPPVRATNENRGTLEAFRVIQQRLRQIGPRPGEEALLALFDRAGFGPNVEFDPTRLPGPLVEGLRGAARDAHKTIHELRESPRGARNGWSPAPALLGAYGDDYLLRATSASSGIGTSVPAEIASMEASADSDGRQLDGRNDYRIRFEADDLPPSDAFWSIAAYAAESRRLLDTHTGRYAIGSRTKGLQRQPSGALELFLSSAAPDDPARRANWLPVRAGPLLLVARIYQPLPAVLEGRYSMPPVVSADD